MEERWGHYFSSSRCSSSVSTEAAAGPLDIAARAIVEVLGFVSLVVGVMGVVEDMAGCGCDESWVGEAAWIWLVY